MSSKKMMGEWARIRRAAMGLIGALSLALVGCGGNDVKVAEKNDALRVPAEQPTTVATVASTPAESPVREEPETIASADSLAPEIALEVESRQVRPGEAVEVSALGSPDVKEVTLQDGMGRSTSFAYDLQAHAWRAFYRVQTIRSRPRARRSGRIRPARIRRSGGFAPAGAIVLDKLRKIASAL
ncbi:MAG: hypothetical protein E6K80_00935 [Candidatus Eisenbacteria bacterium]|uniref:Uncharacterized protein n=1 Tax=Eiseniibacteriota bacterium TaxID=2212470 RepID=A0A538UB13_UNCEI|nr:MAG: hypothetical protein E6K80_00935 [Candidatus Eisenbacteria bacterium]